MSDNASHKAVSRHLPLLRGPLLLNNVICLVLSGLCSYHPIYQAQLAFISISSLTGLLDLIHYLIKKRSPSRQGQSTNADQEDVHGASFVAIVDGVLSVALLVIWIIGLVAFSSWDGLIAVIATFGAFIAWSLHLISFSVPVYIWMKLGRRPTRRCPNCDFDLSSRTAALPAIPQDFGAQKMLHAEQAREQDTEAVGSLANEYDEAETDCLILKDGEDQN